ncbi:hypothetical protein [Comamonas sp. JC664]
MLLEGTLQSWNDERGFGFIAPMAAAPRCLCISPPSKTLPPGPKPASG